MTPKRVFIVIGAVFVFLTIASCRARAADPVLFTQLTAKAQFLPIKWEPNPDRVDGYLVYWAPLWSEDFKSTNVTTTAVNLPVEVSQATWFFITAYRKIAGNEIKESKPSELKVWDGLARPGKNLNLTGVMTLWGADTNVPPIQPGDPAVKSTLDLLLPIASP